MKVLMVIFLTAVVMLAFAQHYSAEHGGHSGEHGGPSGAREESACLYKVCGNSTTCVKCVRALRLTHRVMKSCLGSDCTNVATVSTCITTAKNNTCFTTTG
nr:uncharacterized protein LOC123760622 [Procambarus clarkii]